jgi:hypothetical protein
MGGRIQILHRIPRAMAQLAERIIQRKPQPLRAGTEPIQISERAPQRRPKARNLLGSEVGGIHSTILTDGEHMPTRKRSRAGRGW